MERVVDVSRGLRPPRWGLCLLVGLVALVAAGKPILFDTLDPDCFWHLRVAEQLHTEGIRPLIDKLSFASIQAPWTPYSWLAELGMHALWNHWGWRAALVAQSLMQAGFVILIALACRCPYLDGRSWKSPGAMASGIATAAAAFLSLPYLSFRPVTAALLLLALCAYLLVRDRRAGEQTAMVWLVIPLTGLLVNIHLYAVFVPLWVATLLTGAIWEWWAVPPEHQALVDHRMGRYAALLVGVTVACLGTPMLPGVIGSALRYQFADPMVAGGNIDEMQPFYHGTFGPIAAGVVIVIGLSIFLSRRSLRAGEWLWLLVSVVLLLRLGRFAPVFALAAAPIFAASLTGLSDRVLASRPVCLLMAAVLICGSWRVVNSFPKRDVSFASWMNRNGPDLPGYPCAAADFVAQSVKPDSGRIINEFAWGGYLEWRLAGSFQTFLDGRTQLFTPEFWHATYLGSKTEQQRFLGSIRADAAILPRQRSAFHDTLIALGWRSIYQDDRAQVLAPPAHLAKDDDAPGWPSASILLGQ